MTKDLDFRFIRHNKGYERTTKPYRPFKLLYTESCISRSKAREREIYFKSGFGKEFLKNLNNKSPDGEIGRHARFRV